MHDSACSFTRDLASEFATEKEKVANLEAWQTRQNGTLQRLEAKLDNLRNWIMLTLATALLTTVGWVIVPLIKH